MESQDFPFSVFTLQSIQLIQKSVEFREDMLWTTQQRQAARENLFTYVLSMLSINRVTQKLFFPFAFKSIRLQICNADKFRTKIQRQN